MFEGEPCIENGLGHGYTSCEFLRRHKAIVIIAKGAPSDGWAGIYRASNRMDSTELALDSDGWAALVERGDVGGPAPYEGRYSIETGKVVLALDEEWRRWQQKDRLVYVPVMWGPRLYLVQGDDFASFVNWANAGYYRNDDDIEMPFALPRLRDLNKPLCGLPDVPDRWKSRLHSKPLVVALTHIERENKPPLRAWNSNEDHYRIEIDAGLQSGAFDGMELRPQSNEDCGGAWVEVVLDDVDATRARGRLSVGASSKGVKIPVGLKLTTASRPWSIPECATPTTHS